LHARHLKVSILHALWSRDCKQIANLKEKKREKKKKKKKKSVLIFFSNSPSSQTDKKKQKEKVSGCHFFPTQLMFIND
jgi:hypothetical protein